MLFADKNIIAHVALGEMIKPFCRDLVKFTQNEAGDLRRVISYGTSSYGYDVRLDNDPQHIRMFSEDITDVIDPKEIKEINFFVPRIETNKDGSEYIMIPPSGYLQAPTLEYFKIPRNVLVLVVGKSTYARSGLIVNVTPIEPEFEGNVIIEISNPTKSFIKCYLNEGIAQFLFIQNDTDCAVSYKDRSGKYQGQTGHSPAKL